MESLAQLIDGSFLQSGALWALNTIPGFPPIIQTVHILGIAVVMATVVLMNLRILGLAVPAMSISDLLERAFPWLWIALVSNVISGAFFVLGRPNRYFSNPVFSSKMGFLLGAVALAIFFLAMQKRRPGFWEAPQRRLLARGLAVLSLGLWIMVLMAGRWIAYLEYLQFPLWSMEAFDAGPQPTVWLSMENWPLSQVIAATNWFPLLESIHVIAITLVLGSILWVDLRLLGFAARQLPLNVLNLQLIPWTWGAFVVAVITGLGMFITRASSHIDNPAFRWKFVLMALAGINMAYFHFRVDKQLDHHAVFTDLPRPARIAGGLSLFLWSGVMLAGRWIGHIV
ncbi:MAG: DUF6644 family protein [Gammaproteobacteria bacterium]|nr:hypothetical protein [Pseudomonadales bacterium]MCP5347207.1 hypothetical protein [Pseudomonadales bacterium]